MSPGPGGIACCITDSDDDAPAIAEAGRLARASGHPLHTVHASADHDKVTRAPLAIAGLAGVSLGDAVVIPDGGDAAGAVCEWAASEGVEALVAAPRRGVVARLLLGSFTSHLAQRAPCDVLVARPTDHPESLPSRLPAPVAALMEPVEPLGVDRPLRDALAPLEERGCTLPVVDATGELVGLIGLTELLAAVRPPGPVRVSGTRVPAGDLPQLLHRLGRRLDGRLGDHMRSPLSVGPDDPPLDVVRAMADEGVDALPVVGPWAQVAGIVRASVVLRALAGADAPEAEAAGDESERTRFRRLACCVDDSPTSIAALTRAAELRDGSAGALTIVHALGRPEEVGDTDDARRLLDHGAAMVGAETALLHGDPAVAVARWAAQAHIDLIVAAAHRGPTARLALGSFAGHLAQEAPCPVLLVRSFDERTAPS